MPTEIRTDEELAVLLGTLGNTADEIADKLREMGIRGEPGAPDACPIANWLKAEAADVSDVYVNGEIVLNESIECTPSDAVADFIKRFDAEAFPALIQEG